MSQDFFNSSTLNVFKDLLCLSLNQPSFPLDLTAFPHWEKIALEGKEKGLNLAKPTWPLGFFYNFYTPFPSPDVLREEALKAAHSGAEQMVLPNLRHHPEQEAFLSQLGFIKIGEEDESAFLITKPIEEELRERVGSSRFREIRRLVSKARNDSSTEFLEMRTSPSKGEETLYKIAHLHHYHAEKHSNKVNIFSFPILKNILESNLRENLILGITYAHNSSQVLQGKILIRDHSTLYYISQAIDHIKVTTGNNLYIAAYYEIYQWAFENQIKVVHLGRGGREMKQRLGANLFFKQYHWLHLSPQELLQNLSVSL